MQADDEEPAGTLPLPVAGTSAQHQDILKAGEMLDRILNDPTSDLTSRAHLEGDRPVCTTLVDDTTPRPHLEGIGRCVRRWWMTPPPAPPGGDRPVCTTLVDDTTPRPTWRG